MWGFVYCIEFDFVVLVWCCVFVGQISEYQIIEITENVCNLKKAEADWILQIDIVEQGNKLEVRKIYYLGLFLEQFDELGIWKFVFLLWLYYLLLLWIIVDIVWQECVFSEQMGFGRILDGFAISWW